MTFSHWILNQSLESSHSHAHSPSWNDTRYYSVKRVYHIVVEKIFIASNQLTDRSENPQDNYELNYYHDYYTSKLLMQQIKDSQINPHGLQGTGNESSNVCL